MRETQIIVLKRNLITFLVFDCELRAYTRYCTKKENRVLAKKINRPKNSERLFVATSY